MVKVAPSVLSANFAELKKDLDSIKECHADWVHYDVMDGHFVPNISFGYSILKDVSKVTDLFLDVHLMISDPRKYAIEFINANASLIVFHIEAVEKEEDVLELIQFIKSHNVQVGISIKPATPVSAIEKYLELIDLVLVMSVEPGFGGQKFMPNSLIKAKQIKSYNKNIIIEIDGGINDTNIEEVKKHVDIAVVGSYITNSNDYNKAINNLKN